MSEKIQPFAKSENIGAVVAYLRDECLSKKKYVLLYAYNGTGKTRLSMAFKDAKRKDEARDTLYYNAFTEDLFIWDNDLDADTTRVLRLNTSSKFFGGLEELEMDNRIRPFLHRYSDFDFKINTTDWTVDFFRTVRHENETQIIDHIKVSRGEENIFIWCFFLAIAQLAIDEQEQYSWVKYLYIDDPISSLDDNNAIAVASHLAQLLKKESNKIKTVISTHHTLFFNVLCNELKHAITFHFLKDASTYSLQDTTDTPFFNHVALLKELKKAADGGNLYTYHFNIMRSILEKTATFHGYRNFSACIHVIDDDEEQSVYTRIVNILSHGNYSIFEPLEMLPENKEYFRSILSGFLQKYPFNQELFNANPEEVRR
jgi:wobble nucleotide-excising tRNase